MKSLSNVCIALLSFMMMPIMASAQNQCQGTIRLQVQGNLSDIKFVTANFTSSDDSYSIPRIRPGSISKPMTVNCGSYKVAASAVTKRPKKANLAAASSEPAGACSYNKGSISISPGGSQTVTFPDDFAC